MSQIGIVGLKLDLKIKQGSSVAIPFKMNDATGAARDLTSYIVRSQIRKNKDAPLTQAFTATITNYLGGKFVLSLTPAQTSAIPCGETVASASSKYVWDLEMESPTGFVTPLAYGAVVVFPEVTR